MTLQLVTHGAVVIVVSSSWRRCSRIPRQKLCRASIPAVQLKGNSASCDFQEHPHDPRLVCDPWFVNLWLRQSCMRLPCLQAHVLLPFMGSFGLPSECTQVGDGIIAFHCNCHCNSVSIPIQRTFIGSYCTMKSIFIYVCIYLKNFYATFPMPKQMSKTAYMGRLICTTIFQ